MRLISIVGARPQFIKLFPITRIMPSGISHQIVHTGQHYDESMTDIFFEELGMPLPYVNLGIGSGTQANQTAQMMIGLENIFKDLNPDVVLVYGDTNSTLAGALVAAKMNVNLVHLEAGLRSGNRQMPEELNRIVVDHLSGLLLAPTQTAMTNLENEGLIDKSRLVGDVMVDAILQAKKLIEDGRLTEKISTPDVYLYCTIHRANNTSNRERIVEILNRLSLSTIPIVFLAHPRFLAACTRFDIDLEQYPMHFIPPQSYLNSIDLMMRSKGVITDSGGVQKESYLINKRTLTVRGETEWPETLQGNWNVLDYSLSEVQKKWWERDLGGQSQAFGVGESANTIIKSIVAAYS
jgi:UDP-N-acetylglucosamine 2-epimerase (non-hydrolysing)